MSSAVVGSSATTTAGSPASAIAIITQRGRPGQQAERGQAENALAGSGLTDQGDDLPRLDRKSTPRSAFSPPGKVTRNPRTARAGPAAPVTVVSTASFMNSLRPVRAGGPAWSQVPRTPATRCGSP
jgi:hypothetical protein